MHKHNATKTMKRNGHTFVVPSSYRKLEDYAAVCAINYRICCRYTTAGYRREAERYEAILLRLQAAGITTNYNR